MTTAGEPPQHEAEGAQAGRCSPCVPRPQPAELITDAWRCQAPRALAAEVGRGRR
jgi:hypothetical protein